MIEVKNVSLIINKYKILANVSLEIKEGEAVGLVGANGSGKTMLMKCICGFNTMFTGEIKVNGKRIGKDMEFPEKTGIIIETPGFIPYMSGYENLKLLSGSGSKISKEQIYYYMNLAGLDPENKKNVKKYSLGMRQRLGLAQALMEDPDILILDEPFNGIDKKMLLKMRDIFVGEKSKGKTILMASHNEKDIEYICDRKYEIDEGAIVPSSGDCSKSMQHS
ncbi:MAG: ABC transporter ATP-binding protein [Lachnospiraceae bacterium]|nr:ABC transporter ATP-binding protein [Lachnospiraceae bacterium]